MVRTELRQPNRSIHAWFAAQKTYARYLLATEDYARAYELLKPAMATADRLGQHLQAISLSLLFSIAAAHLGRQQEAASMIATMDEFYPDVRSALTVLLKSGAKKTHSNTKTVTITNRLGERQTITAREMDVLIRISDGLSNKEIAGQFQLSEATIKFNRRNLYQNSR